MKIYFLKKKFKYKYEIKIGKIDKNHNNYHRKNDEN